MYSDEVEFDVSMDTRTGKPVAVQVVKLKKGTVVFEVYSEERILGEVASPAVPQGGPQPFMGTGSNSFKPAERGEIIPGGKYGSLCYDRMGVRLWLCWSHTYKCISSYLISKNRYILVLDNNTCQYFELHYCISGGLLSAIHSQRLNKQKYSAAVRRQSFVLYCHREKVERRYYF